MNASASLCLLLVAARILTCVDLFIVELAQPFCCWFDCRTCSDPSTSSSAPVSASLLLCLVFLCFFFVRLFRLRLIVFCVFIVVAKYIFVAALATSSKPSSQRHHHRLGTAMCCETLQHRQLPWQLQFLFRVSSSIS